MAKKDFLSGFVTAAGVAGVLAFFLLIVGSFLLAVSKPDYDPIFSTLSELGEKGSSTGFLATSLFISIGLCEIIFGVGVLLRASGRKTAVIGAVLVLVNGLFDYIGSSVFPVDAGGQYVSFSGQMHFMLTLIGMSAMIFPAFFLWRACAAEGLKRESFVVFIFAIVILIGGILFNVAFFTESFVGLAQRFLDYVYFAWIGYFSLMTIRQEQRKMSI